MCFDVTEMWSGGLFVTGIVEEVMFTELMIQHFVSFPRELKLKLWHIQYMFYVPSDRLLGSRQVVL